MPAIFHSKDILVEYYNNQTHPAWTKDLICKAILSNGLLADDDLNFIQEEISNRVEKPSLTMPTSFGLNPPKNSIKKLKHVSGVNALAPNQELRFCEEGLTMVFGFNGSGKSSYFRILNRLANGAIAYPILPNIYDSNPSPCSVVCEYSVDGEPRSYGWNGNDDFPEELRHIRFFDANYSYRILHSHGYNIYMFECYFLKIFQAINDAVEKFERLGQISKQDSQEIKSLCNDNICITLKNALLLQFRKELDSMGMGYLQVNLDIGDLMSSNSFIQFHILHHSNVDQILSEAELKCASIALFLAENELLDVGQPIVFDDPVNSLDAHYVENFLNRILELPNQVIIFTHNIQLQTLLLDKKGHNIQICSASSNAVNRQPTKKNVFVCEVLSDNPNSNGYVVNYNISKSLYYLEKAKEMLKETPIQDCQIIIDTLRHAVEWMIDEVVFRGKSPLKFRGRSNIPWSDLISITNAGSQTVITLRKIYNQLSNSGSHVGIGSVYSSMTRQEMHDCHLQLRQIYDEANL